MASDPVAAGLSDRRMMFGQGGAVAWRASPSEHRMIAAINRDLALNKARIEIEQRF